MLTSFQGKDLSFDVVTQVVSYFRVTRSFLLDTVITSVQGPNEHRSIFDGLGGRYLIGRGLQATGSPSWRLT